MRKFILGVAAAALTAGLAPSSAAVTDADRTSVYREFRSFFDAQRYVEALPVAERLVQLTEEQYGAEDAKLAAPLTNLATTHYRLGNFPAAEQHYLRSVQVLEAAGAPSNRELIRPLHGLGATYAAAGQYESAVAALRRAVDLSRNVDGLFNLEQLAMLDPLIETYVALGQFAEAEKEHQYAFRVAESAYGRSDARLLKPLDRYARWFEFVGRYATARSLHLRALGIAEQPKGRPEAVPALRGIARTYRLEFVHGVESAETAARDPLDASPTLNDLPDGGLNADGERALLLALQVIERATPLDRRLHGDTLVDLGDWYMTGGAVNRAVQAYEKAWSDLSAEGGSTERLATPEQLAYRPPSASVTRTRLDPEDYEALPVEVRLTVGKDGRVSDVVAVPGTAAPENVVRSVISAARKARYRPRLEDGKPAATANVALIERMAVRIEKPERSG